MLLSLVILNLIFIWSCQESEGNIHSISQIQNKPKEVVLDTTLSTKLSSIDNYDKTKKKVYQMASESGQGFSEKLIYDEYFKSNVSEFFLTDKNSGRKTTVVIIHQDRIKTITTILKEIKCNSKEKFEQNRQRLKNQVEGSSEYQVVDKHFLQTTDNGEVWFLAMFSSWDKEKKKQIFWFISSPETDFGYLKFMTQNLISRSTKDKTLKYVIG